MSYTTFTYKKLYELFEPVDINCVLLGESTHGTKEFYDIRMELYKRRKLYLLYKMNREARILKNKIKFLKEIMSKMLIFSL